MKGDNMPEKEYLFTVEFEISATDGGPCANTHALNVISTTAEDAIPKARKVPCGRLKLGCVVSVTRQFEVHAK